MTSIRSHLAPRLRWPRVLVLAIAVVLSASACGSGDDGAGQPAAQDLRIGMGLVTSNFDPISTTAVADYTYLRLVYDTLVSTDNGTPEPWAAESFEAIDPAHWRFKIREGIQFSNGEPLNAEAVRYTFQRALDDPSTPWRVRIEQIQRMEIVDDLTIDFFLDQPVGNFPTRTSVVWIVPPVYTEENPGALVTAPIGSGPFTVAEYTPSERVLLQGRPDYWNNAPELTTVELRAIPEESTRVAALAAGDIDVAHRVLPDFVPQIEANGARVISVPSGQSANLFFQTSRDTPIADVRVRRAIDYAIDKPALTEAITQGYGEPLQGQIVGKDSIGFNPDVTTRPYDPDRARQLLAEAGYANGVEIQFDYPLGRYFRDKELAEAVSAYLEQVGIDVVQNPMEGGAWLDRLYSGESGPINYWSIQDAPAYDLSWTLEIFLSDNIRKLTDDPQFDAMLAESFAITDPEERDAVLQEVAAHFSEQAYAVNFHRDPGIYAVSPRVEGIEFLSSTYINLFDARVVE